MKEEAERRNKKIVRFLISKEKGNTQKGEEKKSNRRVMQW